MFLRNPAVIYTHVLVDPDVTRDRREKILGRLYRMVDLLLDEPYALGGSVHGGVCLEDTQRSLADAFPPTVINLCFLPSHISGEVYHQLLSSLIFRCQDRDIRRFAGSVLR
jgi:hypothetical protein